MARLFSDGEHCQNAFQLLADSAKVCDRRLLGLRLIKLRQRACIELVASATDGKALFIQKLANTANEQDLVMLVVTSVAAPLDGLKLSELLLPVAQNMRFDTTQFTDLTDGEVALGRYRRKRFSRVGFGGSG